jgi:hypothetical protein
MYIWVSYLTMWFWKRGCGAKRYSIKGKAINRRRQGQGNEASQTATRLSRRCNK